MLYTIIILISGVYIGQEYEIIPSIRILSANLLIHLRNLRDPIENAIVNTDKSIYEKLVKMFWW